MRNNLLGYICVRVRYCQCKSVLKNEQENRAYKIKKAASIEAAVHNVRCEPELRIELFDGGAAWKPGSHIQFLFDTEEVIVFGDAFAAGD